MAPRWAASSTWLDAWRSPCSRSAVPPSTWICTIRTTTPAGRSRSTASAKYSRPRMVSRADTEGESVRSRGGDEGVTVAPVPTASAAVAQVNRRGVSDAFLQSQCGGAWEDLGRARHCVERASEAFLGQVKAEVLAARALERVQGCACRVHVPDVESQSGARDQSP